MAYTTPPDGGGCVSRGITKAGDMNHAGDLIPAGQTGAANPATHPQVDITGVGNSTLGLGASGAPTLFKSGGDASNEGADSFSSKW